MMGHWEGERQRELFVATERVTKAPRRVFYDKFNRLLRAGLIVGARDCARSSVPSFERRSIPQERCCRMLFIGYFEGLIRNAGSHGGDGRFSLKVLLELEPFDEAAGHSSLTKIGDRLPTEVYREVFPLCCAW